MLCRSLEVWQERAVVNLPADIRPLIEATYADRAEDGLMASWLKDLDDGTTQPKRLGRKALQQLARIGLATDGKTLPEAQAQTRYSESDSFEVLLLRELQIIPGENTTRLTLLDGRTLRLPHHREALDKPQWRNLTAE